MSNSDSAGSPYEEHHDSSPATLGELMYVQKIPLAKQNSEPFTSPLKKTQLRK